MKTKYSEPVINIMQVAPALLQQASINSRSYGSGNAQTMAASREGSGSSWEDED